MAKEKEIRIKILQEYELQIERLNYKMRSLLGYIQDLETKKVILENRDLLKNS